MIAFVVAAVVLLIAFGLTERRVGPRALVPRDVIANRDFAGACLAVLLISACFFAALLYLPQFMTKVLGYSALEGGLGLLPMMGTFALVSFVAGPLYNRIGAKTTVSRGRGLHRGRDVPALVDRPRRRLRGARAGHGRARHRRRPLLLLGHDRRA